MNSPKLSVVIPVYNAEKYICQCLDSVLAQPMQDIEIICVDDGSVDNSSAILDEYDQKDSRVRVLQQKNMRSGIARNNGLKMARGEYIHFLDADDYLMEDAYSSLYEKAKKYNLDYVRGKAYIIEETTGRVSDNEFYTLGAVSSQNYERVITFAEIPDVFTRISYAPWNGIYQRQFLVDYNVFFDDIMAFDDHLFYYRMITQARRIMFVDTFILCYRKEVENSLVSNYVKRFECHFRSFEEIKKQCSNLPEELQKVILNAELKSIFSWYRRSVTTGECFTQNHKLLLSFVEHLDISLVENTSFVETWYLEYLLLKDEASGIKDMCKKEYLISTVKKTRWKFLFDIIPHGAKAIIYTAGYSGQIIYKILTSTRHCEVILWVDRNYKAFQDMGLPVHSPDDMDKQSFDLVLIAAEMESTSNEIRKNLIARNISVDKIIRNDMRLNSSMNFKDMQNFLSHINEYNKLIVYGAAKIGETVINFFQYINKYQNIAAVAVSDLDSNPDKLFGVPVVSIDELKQYRNSALVLIATSDPYHSEINQNLRNLGFKNIYTISTSLKNKICNALVEKNHKKGRHLLRKLLNRLSSFSTKIQGAHDIEKRKDIITDIIKEFGCRTFCKNTGDNGKGEKNDILFLSPPSWDMYSPFSAVPCLVAKLQEENISCRQIDFGILCFHTAMQENWKKMAERFQSRRYYQDFVSEYVNNAYSTYEEYLDALWFFRDKSGFPLEEVKKRYREMTRVQMGVLEKYYADLYRYKANPIDFNNCNNIELEIENTDISLLWKTILDGGFLPLLFDAPDVVGISITGTSQFLPGCVLAKLIKACSPNTKIILGGSCADLFFCSSYKKKSDIFHIFDYVVTGEGETALTMLMKFVKNGCKGDPADIPSIACLSSNGQIIRGEEYIEEVETLPAPCYEGLDLSLYLAPEPILPYQSSRGCHYGRCAFCNHNEKYRHNYRTKSAQKTIHDLLALRDKYNIQNIQFVDEAIRPDCFKEMVFEMDKHPEFKTMHWIYYSRVSRKYTKEILDIARRNGCNLAMFGIETFNQRLLNLIKKGISANASRYCLRLFKECGIMTFAWLMCNLPSETIEEARDDIEETKKMAEYLDCVSVGPFCLDINTDMYRNMSEYRITKFDSYDGTRFSSENNGAIIDTEAMLNVFNNEYSPLGRKLFFTNNRYVIFFDGKTL
jgi:anaerobic magnesium-protoporphyrin IX monomethyl ester cyclase